MIDLIRATPHNGGVCAYNRSPDLVNDQYQVTSRWRLYNTTLPIRAYALSHRGESRAASHLCLIR